jgi:methionine-S-sulfoxide reductase
MLRNLATIFLFSFMSLAACSRGAAEGAQPVPPPAFDPPPSRAGLQKAVLAGGCFWGVQGVYQHMKGVRNVLSGYSGGTAASANYEDVSRGNSGHAEAVEIVFDPAQVSYGQILQVFFAVVHDPTQLNRQGPDRGPQYRSAIFYSDDAQRKIAEAYVAQLGKARVFPRPIVTRLDALREFHVAEDYHQDYLLNHPEQPYIAIHDIPKVRSLQRLFPALYTAKPVTVASSGAAASDVVAGGGAAMTRSEPARAGDTGAAMEAGAMMSAQHSSGSPLSEGEMPELRGITEWMNSKPLTRESLRGKVVVIDFWTYSCINCLRALPHVNAWYQHYKDSGLVVIGVHSPEFGFEKDRANVRMAIDRFSIRFPVAMDNDFAVWKAFNNRFWPAKYFIDAQGRIRGHHFGEGKYARSERTIRTLLMEAGASELPEPLEEAIGQGVSAASDTSSVASPETYLGYERAENFASPGGFARDSAKVYDAPRDPPLNHWGLQGRWQVSREHATLAAAPGRIVFKFRARDLHLVLSQGAVTKPVRIRVLLDGKPPAGDHGLDVDANGNGEVREQRLYQLIRQSGAVEEHEFTIEFLDPGVQAYSFTFG